MFTASSTNKTSTLFFVIAASLLFATSVTSVPAPIPVPIPDDNKQLGNSYSGTGGHAPGGSVTSGSSTHSGFFGGGLLDLFSENAGKAGDASSGTAISSPGSVSKARHHHSSAGNSDKTTNSQVGNAYSGAGGDAGGGNVETSPALIKVFSGNGGKGGDASSGSAQSGVSKLSSLGSGFGRGQNGKRVARFYKINLD